MLIDSHCHLEGFDKRGEVPAVLERARQAGVTQLVTIGTSMEDWARYAALAAAHPGTVYWTAGLHPTSVEEDWRDQVIQLSTWFGSDPAPVALGECGLDYFHLPKDADEAAITVVRQKQAFQAQLELALQFDCPLVVHSRNSHDDCVAMIDASGVDWRKVVFHCFTGTVAQVHQLNERGGRASFTGVATYKNAGSVRDAAAAQGPDLVMVETDCPYLTPEPHRKLRNEPAFLRLTAVELAGVLDMAFEDFAARATANTRQFYAIA